MTAASPRSFSASRRPNRRTIVLGLVALAAVAAAVVVTLPHHHRKTARDDVAAYVTRINAAENRLRVPLSKISLAYLHFSQTRRLGPREAKELVAARSTLLRVRRRVARIVAPPAAQRLRALVLHLVDGEAGVTLEVAQFARFLPAFDVVIGRIRAADLALARGLAAVHAPTPHLLRGTRQQIAHEQAVFAAASAASAAAQADVVEAYDAKLVSAAARLRRLAPPPPFAPAYRAQLRALRSTAAAGARLVAELRKPQRPRVAALSLAFTSASRASQSVAAQRAEIAALRAYNARVKALGASVGAVDGELQRLQQGVH